MGCEYYISGQSYAVNSEMLCLHNSKSKNHVIQNLQTENCSHYSLISVTEHFLYMNSRKNNVCRYSLNQQNYKLTVHICTVLILYYMLCFFCIHSNKLPSTSPVTFFCPKQCEFQIIFIAQYSPYTPPLSLPILE
jgi:hypothetical protein